MLFLVGRGAGVRRCACCCARTRWGLVLRTVGESADAARAMGYDVDRVRLLATMAGGFLAGVGGSFLSLYYPGSWNEGLSSGQGLMAVALVIFARWDPVRCLWASLLFGGASALGPALQSVGVTSRLLPVQRRALRADAGDHDRHQLRHPHPGRSAGRADQSRDDADRKEERHDLRPRRSVSLALRRRPAPREHRADRHRHADRLLRRGRLHRAARLRHLADPGLHRAHPEACWRRCGRRASTSCTRARGTGPIWPTCPPTSAGARAR